MRTEILAGITTFFAMAYILVVNPQILSAPFVIRGQAVYAEQVANGVFFATCLIAFIGTLIGGVGAYFAGLGLARIVYVNFEWNYTLPPYSSNVTMIFYLITFAVILVSTLVATVIAGRKLTREQRAALQGFDAGVEMRQTAKMRAFRDNVQSMYGVDPYKS